VNVLGAVSVFYDPARLNNLHTNDFVPVKPTTEEMECFE